MARLSYRRHRFPPEIIRHAIWLYLRFTPELPRCRGAAGRAWSRHLLRNGATLSAEIRSRDRATAAPAAPSAEQPMAPGRDGGTDRREAEAPLAGRRSRGRGPRSISAI